jgi:signal transduction histidine kinase
MDRVRTERQLARAEAEGAARLRQVRDELAAHAATLERVNGDLQREVRSRQEAERELQRANEAKSEFVSLVAHELKTPLACIKTSVDMLVSGRTGNLVESQRRFVELAARNVDRLQRILGDLLDLSRIEAGRLEIENERLDLPALLADLAAGHRVGTEAAGLDLVLEVEPGLGALWTDGHRVAQVVSNLVSNATKFTPPGGRIRVGARGAGGNVEVWVADTGVGLSEEDQRRVFERFYQARAGRTLKTGTGLGLAISQHLCRCLGGELRVESRAGEGSRFSFSLPSSPGHAEPALSGQPPSGAVRQPGAR